MNKRLNRALSLFLCVLMCLSLLPAEALAADTGAVRETVRFAVSNGKPKITAQPKSLSVKQSAKVTFKVSASGKGLKYQWYYRKSAKGSWIKYSGKTKATLSFTAGRVNGYQYRCKVSNASGHVYSKAATLKVNYVKYRALLIGETLFGSEVANRNKGDVKLMRNMLKAIKTPKGGSYTITSRYNLDKPAIQKAIKSYLGGADSNDVSLFFLATHGDTGSSGYYAGAMVTPDKYGYIDDFDGWLTMDELAGWLKDVKGKVIVILGSCGSGAAIKSNGLLGGGKEFDPDAFNESVIRAFAAADEPLTDGQDGLVANTGEFRKSKFYVLTAAAYQESSWGQEGSNPYNYFPYYVAKGGRGAADANKNGKVTLKELYAYANKNARGPYYDGYDYYYQHARVYPTNSSYVLFK